MRQLVQREGKRFPPFSLPIFEEGKRKFVVWIIGGKNKEKQDEQVSFCDSQFESR